MEWRQHKYGGGETMTLADGRVSLHINLNVVPKDTPQTWSGNIDVHIGTKNFKERQDAELNTLKLARHRFRQAISEINSLIGE